MKTIRKVAVSAIIAILVFVVLAFLLKFALLPLLPDQWQAWYVWLGATIGATILTLASLVQFTGYSLKDLFSARQAAQPAETTEVAADDGSTVLSRVSPQSEIRAKSIEAVDMAYKLFAEFDASLTDLVAFHLDDTAMRIQRVSDAAQAFQRFFRENDIYFRDQLIAAVGEYNQVALEAWRRMLKSQASLPGDPRRSKAWFEASDRIESELPKLRLAVKAEFRKMLGNAD